MNTPPISEPSPSIRIVRIAFALIVLAGLLELYSQLYFYQWAGRQYQSVRVNKWSPYGLVRNNPRLTSPGFVINSQGFREESEFARVKPEKTIRVMILGASVMYSGLGGWFPPDTKRVKPDETITHYLRQLLLGDPELADVNVEVINAAVNFNRANEIACGYLDEYQFWDPDIVVIGASANTFAIEPPTRASLIAKSHNIQGWHPWRFEFERQANDCRVLPLFERAYSTLEESSAAAALSRKIATKANDVATGLSQQFGSKYKQRFAPPAPATAERATNDDSGRLATREEYDSYIQDALGFFKAIQVCAQAKQQSVYFFWEYYLVQLKGLKPLTDAEQRLYEGNLRVRPLVADASFNFRARDTLSTELSAAGSQLIDPLESLKSCKDSVFIDYIHYTPDGNRFMAKIMYDTIRSRAVSIASGLKKNPAN